MVVQLYTTFTRSEHELSISGHTVRTVKIQSNIAGREKKNAQPTPLSEVLRAECAYTDSLKPD
jgi:hypothetical protein